MAAPRFVRGGCIPAAVGGHDSADDEIQFTVPAFQVLPTGNSNYQVQAANRVNAGEGPEFEISGAGALPALQAQAQPAPKAPTTVATPAPSAPSSSQAPTQRVNASGAVAGSGLSAPVSRRKWWVLGVGGFLVLGAGGFLLWRGERLSAQRALGWWQRNWTRSWRLRRRFLRKSFSGWKSTACTVRFPAKSTIRRGKLSKERSSGLWRGLEPKRK